MKQIIPDSDQRFRYFFENINIGLAICDIPGRFLDVNPSFVRLTGYSKEELNRMTFMDITYPDDLLIELPLLEQAVKQKTYSYNIEKRYIRKDKTIIWVELCVSVIQDERGKPLHLMGTAHDITSRKQSEEKLRNSEQKIRISEEKFSKLFQLSPSAIILSRLSNRVIAEINETACKFTGYTHDELLGNSIVSLHIWNNPGELENYQWLLKQNRSVVGFEANFRMKSGEVKIGVVSGEVINIHNEEYVLEIISDVTLYKQTEQDLLMEKEKADKGQKKLEESHDIAKLGSWELDIESGIFTFTDSFYKIFHTNAREMSGYKMSVNEYASNFVYPGDASKVAEETQKAIETQDINFNRYLEHRIIYKDGGIGYLGVWFFVVKDKHGKTIKTYGINQDITSRKMAELELLRAKEKAEENEFFLRESQKAGNIGSYKTDFVAGIWKSSETLDRIFGTDASYKKDVEGWLSIVHPDDRQMMKDYYLNEVIGEQKTFAKEYRIRRINDNETRWVFGYGDVTFDNNGNILEMTGTIQDITDRKKIENDLIIAKEKAEESDRLKTAFLQNMSHELRTPLNAIMGFSSLMIENINDKEAITDYESIITKSSNDLLQIVNNILDIASLESGQMTIHNEQFIFEKLINDSLKTYYQVARKTFKENIQFKMNFKDLQNILISTDFEKLKQILTNIINNAYKFTDTGEIEVGGKLINNSTLSFYVKDTGIGIPVEKQKEIFNRFYQVDPWTSRLYGGTGLGLTIVKGLLDLLGGEIWVESVPGKGSIFTFTIPVKIISNEEKQESNQESYSKVNLKDLSGISILIVEDDEFSMKYFKQVLSESNCIMHFARSGKEAIKIAFNNSLDIILMDIRLPDISGYEVTRQIKSYNPGIYIIAQTAYVSEDDMDKALDAGCDDFISKPISAEMLIYKLKNYHKS